MPATGETSKQLALRDPDVRLMLRVRDDEAGAFEELVELYQHRLVAVMNHLVGSPEEAEDLAQEVFLRVYRARTKYRPKSKFSTWLFTIANNLALNSLRPQGTVIDLGFYQGGAPNVQFGEAFHHNGLRHICAQIRRVPRRLANTWDRRRLAQETISFVRDCGPAIREHLITDVVPFGEAQRAYDALDAGAPGVIQTVLEPADLTANLN